jgi:hypothetical protein
MKTAVKPQAKAPAKTSVRPQALPGRPAGNRPGAAAGGQGAGQNTVPATTQSRRSKLTPLTPMRVQTAKSMSRLASSVRESHPELPAAQHLMDAARTLRAGQHEASQRHLRAAMFSLTPQSLMRNGQHTDDLHIGARSVMHDVHRHLLLVKDLDDVAAKNEAAIARDSYGDDAPAMRQPDPNAGYGPGANAQKPTARQPGGNRALNAPNRADGGGSDPNVADPVGPQPKGSKQFAREGHAMSYTWDDVSAVIDLCASSRRVIDLDWAEWDAGHRGGGGSASQKAHDTASATAKATMARHRAEKAATRPVKVGDDMPSKGFSSPGGLKASKLTAGDKVMASYGGGQAGLKMHDVTGVKHQTTITVRNTRTGKTHVQKVNSASKRDDGKAFGETKPGDKIQGHYRGDPAGGTDEYEVVKARHQTTLKTADPDTGESHTQTVNSNGNVRMSRKTSRISAASARTQAAGNAKRAATRAANKAGGSSLANDYGELSRPKV